MAGFKFSAGSEEEGRSSELWFWAAAASRQGPAGWAGRQPLQQWCWVTGAGHG